MPYEFINAATTGDEPALRVSGPVRVWHDLGMYNGNLIRTGLASKIALCWFFMTDNTRGGVPTGAGPYLQGTKVNYPTFLGMGTSKDVMVTSCPIGGNTTIEGTTTTEQIYGLVLSDGTGNNGGAVKVRANNDALDISNAYGRIRQVANNSLAQSAVALNGAAIFRDAFQIANHSTTFNPASMNNYIQGAMCGIEITVVSEFQFMIEVGSCNSGSIVPGTMDGLIALMKAKVRSGDCVPYNANSFYSRAIWDVIGGLTAKQYIAQFPYFLFQWAPANYNMMLIHAEGFITE